MGFSCSSFCRSGFNVISTRGSHLFIFIIKCNPEWIPVIKGAINRKSVSSGIWGHLIYQESVKSAKAENPHCDNVNLWQHDWHRSHDIVLLLLPGSNGGSGSRSGFVFLGRHREHLQPELRCEAAVSRLQSRAAVGQQHVRRPHCTRQSHSQVHIRHRVSFFSFCFW